MKIEKFQKFVANFHDKKKKKICYSHQKFKTSMKSWISFEKVHRVIKFNQKDCLKPYTDMNTELGNKVKNYFEICTF